MVPDWKVPPTTTGDADTQEIAVAALERVISFDALAVLGFLKVS